jgi:predicted nucleic acid-binding protein
MILVDTSVWVDHFRSHNEVLAGLLEGGAVLSHPFVVGELALGSLRQRATVLNALTGLPRAAIAAEHEILRFIELHSLFGRGIGYVDVHLLAATMLTAGALLWTIDKRLCGLAEELGVAADRV